MRPRITRPPAPRHLVRGQPTSFFRVIPKRCKRRQIVDGLARSPVCAARRSANSGKVATGVSSTRARRTSSPVPARRDRRPRPGRGAAEPVVCLSTRQRRIVLTLTPKRATASPVGSPASRAASKLSRKSVECCVAIPPNGDTSSHYPQSALENGFDDTGHSPRL